MMLGLVSLSGCNQQSGGDAASGDPFGVSQARPEDRFGKAVGEAYRAKPNSKPRDLRDGEMVPVSKTAKPVEFN